MPSGIYCIENIVDHKKYIGQAVDIEKRFKDHKNNLKSNDHINKYLQNVYNKYGEDIFNYYIIQELEKNAEKLDLMETYWIVYFKTYVYDGEGYNFNLGGGSNYGMKLDEEAKMKISDFPKKKKEDASSKYYGVHKTIECWSVSFTYHREFFYFGTFDTEIEAAIMYNIKAKEIIGDSARLNEVDCNIIPNKRVLKNKNKRKNGIFSSNYVGVYYDNAKHGWISRISKGEKKYSLGIYDTENGAAVAYNKKAIELYGEKAIVNIVENICDEDFIRRLPSKLGSIYKGVYYHKASSKWMSRIFVGTKGIYVGLYSTEIEAAIAYNNKAIELFGDNAKLNEITMED
jgi:group I intron endonuclease